jgi:hypothetical protein
LLSNTILRAAVPSSTGELHRDFDLALNEIAEAGLGNADQLFGRLRPNYKKHYEKSIRPRISVQISAEKMAVHARALQRVAEFALHPHQVIACDDLTRKSNEYEPNLIDTKKRGRKSGEAVRRRREIVCQVAKKPSDLDRPDIVKT